MALIDPKQLQNPADTTKYLRGDGTWQVPPGGGGASWGAITGTLSAQTDLQTALNGKVSTTGNETISGLKTFSTGTAALTHTGDMSAVTAAFTRWNLFQSSTTNGNTYLTVAPNGTAGGSAVDLLTASSGSDFLIVRFGVGASTVRFNQVPQGAATVKPWEWALSAVPYMTMFTDGKLFVGSSAANDGVNQLQVSGTATVTAPADGATTAQVVTADWINRNMAAAIAAAYPHLGGL